MESDLDFERPERGGDFLPDCKRFVCMTPDLEVARWFGGIAAQQSIFTALGGPGVPGTMIFACDMPLSLLERFQAEAPPWLRVSAEAYRFSPHSFSTMNAEMGNIQITFEQ